MGHRTDIYKQSCWFDNYAHYTNTTAPTRQHYKLLGSGYSKNHRTSHWGGHLGSGYNKNHRTPHWGGHLGSGYNKNHRTPHWGGHLGSGYNTTFRGDIPWQMLGISNSTTCQPSRVNTLYNLRNSKWLHVLV